MSVLRFQKNVLFSKTWKLSPAGSSVLWSRGEGGRNNLAWRLMQICSAEGDRQGCDESLDEDEVSHVYASSGHQSGKSDTDSKL